MADVHHLNNFPFPRVLCCWKSLAAYEIVRYRSAECRAGGVRAVIRSESRLSLPTMVPIASRADRRIPHRHLHGEGAIPPRKPGAAALHLLLHYGKDQRCRRCC